MKRRGATLAEIETVYRDRLDELRSVAAAILRNRDAAADVVQDAFALAVRRRSTFRGDGPVDAWLWRFVVRAALTRRRDDSKPTPIAPAAAMNGHVGERDADVQDAVALLPERQRLALFLRYYADLDYGAIAEILDVKRGTVAATLNAAHAAMRRRLEEVTR